MQRGSEAYNRKATTLSLDPSDRALAKQLLERGGLGQLRSFWL